MSDPTEILFQKIYATQKTDFHTDSGPLEPISFRLFVRDAVEVTPVASFMPDYFSPQVKQRSAAISNF